MDIHNAIADLGNEKTGVIRIHAGIAAGEVVASHVGSDDHEEFTVTAKPSISLRVYRTSLIPVKHSSPNRFTGK